MDLTIEAEVKRIVQEALAKVPNENLIENIEEAARYRSTAYSLHHTVHSILNYMESPRSLNMNIVELNDIVKETRELLSNVADKQEHNPLGLLIIDSYENIVTRYDILFKENTHLLMLRDKLKVQSKDLGSKIRVMREASFLVDETFEFMKGYV